MCRFIDVRSRMEGLGMPGSVAVPVYQFSFMGYTESG